MTDLEITKVRKERQMSDTTRTDALDAEVTKMIDEEIRLQNPDPFKVARDAMILYGRLCGDLEAKLSALLAPNPDGSVKGWFLPRDKVNNLVAASLAKTIASAKQSHICDIVMRLNGKDVGFEADWVKYLEER